MAQIYLDLDPDEQVLFTARRHWINIFPIILSSFLLILFVSYALGWLLANPGKLPAGLPAASIAMVLTILVVISVLISVVAYFIFRQNRITLTNRHYIQITQAGLFNRTFSKLTLDEIQDCEGKRNGFFATLLGYGEILIETAGEEENFDFGPVGDPLNIAELINDAHQKYSHRSVSNQDTKPASEAPPPATNPPASA